MCTGPTSRWRCRTRDRRRVNDILDIAGTRTHPGELLCLQASEKGGTRDSFDINIYRAGLSMAEVYPLLTDTASYYSIDINRFAELYEAVKTDKLGHISGDIGKEGRDFLTFCFSEKGSTRSQHRHLG